MPRLLQDRYNLEIVINGETVDWGRLQFDEYSMHESVKQKFPTAELKFSCDYHYILENPIVDGSTFVITLEDLQVYPPTPPQTYEMRAFNTNFKTASSQFTYYISLYLDAMDLHQARSKSYGKTTSSNAIAAAAADAGLSPSVDPAADVQVWLRRNIKGADFIYQTASHSYASPTSIFVTGIGATKILRHYDLTQHTYTSPGGWVFKNMPQEIYYPAPNEILYEDIKYKTVSGTNNAYAGYGRTSGTYNLEKGFLAPFFNAASLVSGAFQIAKSAMASQRAQTLPYDSDNTHENYLQAAIQNTGGKALYSVMVELVTRFGRNPLLLDYVTLEPYSTALNDITPGGLLYPWAGGYFISEIHTLVTQATVNKKYTLLRDGLNLGVNMGLLGEPTPSQTTPSSPSPQTVSV